MSKELTKKNTQRLYYGIFLTILGIILSLYFLTELMLHLKEGIFRGWGAMFLNFLIFSAACIVFPGVCLIFISVKKRKKFLEDPKITEADLVYLKHLIYNYLKQNQNKAFTTDVLKNSLKNNIEKKILKTYFEENIDKILNKMKIDGNIQTIQKNGISYNILK